MNPGIQMGHLRGIVTAERNCDEGWERGQVRGAEVTLQ